MRAAKFRAAKLSRPHSLPRTCLAAALAALGPLLLIGILVGVLAGCGPAPGHPRPGPEIPRPDEIVDFHALYAQNCSACHGAAGKDGPSIPLANPTYQALVTPAELERVIAQGEPGASMPAFGVKYGGTLTKRQVGALVAGIRQAWYKPEALAGMNPPPYESQAHGDPARGRQVYSANCASCHEGKGKAGSITGADFLSLVSDRGLRTLIIAGRPDIGQPDWRGWTPDGKAAFAPMTDQQVTDLVAWLASRRPSITPAAAPTPAVPPQQPGRGRGEPK